jgi:hypothetical protein
MARENWGANFRVSRWARWNWMNFWIMMVSDQMDIMAKTTTTPLAKYPI